MNYSMKKISVILFAAFASVAFFGCTGGNNSGSISTTDSGNQSTTSNVKGDDEDETESSEPTKAQMIADLNNAYRRIANENFEEAKKYFIVPEDASNEELQDELAQLVRKYKLKPDNIEDFDDDGKFGPLEEIFPSKAANWMEESEISENKLSKCYAIKMDEAQVAALWTGSRFRFFHYKWDYEVEVIEAR